MTFIQRTANRRGVDVLAVPLQDLIAIKLYAGDVLSARARRFKKLSQN